MASREYEYSPLAPTSSTQQSQTRRNRNVLIMLAITAFCAALLYTGLGSSSSAPSDSLPKSPADSAVEVENPCESSELPTGFHLSDIDTTHYFEHEGHERSYHVWLSDSYTQNTPAPAVFGFHGYGGTGKSMFELSNISTYSDVMGPQGVVGVFPQGLNNSWSGAPYHPYTISNDTSFTLALLSHLQHTLCLDPKRSYAVGKSNGGGFALSLGCSPGGRDRFAALAGVSAAVYDGSVEGCGWKVGADSTVEGGSLANIQPVPMLEFHGLQDSVIEYEGGVHKGHQGNPDIPYAAIPSLTEAWRMRDGCRSPPKVSEEGEGQVTKRQWTACGLGYNRTWIGEGAANAEMLKAYTIEEWGHWWPSKSPTENTKETTTIDATPMILEWFNNWRMK